MKNTKRIITAAASFVALLFAPLAQAQVTDSGAITLEVLAPGIQIEALDMSFGSVLPDDSVGDNLDLACDATSSGAPTASASNAVVSGDAQCGVVTISSGAAVGYTLKIESAALIHETDTSRTLTAVLDVYRDGNATPILTGADPENPKTSGTINLVLNASPHIFYVGGAIVLGVAGATEQPAGTYTGAYTITATAQNN